MGCFSFLCKVCGDPINSDGRRGEHCTLYLLVNGKIVEQMTGQYDSYGCVLDEHDESVKWESYNWDGVCELMFSKNLHNGIVAIHTDCQSKHSRAQIIKVLNIIRIDGNLIDTRSEDDPMQGSGEFIHIIESEYGFRWSIVSDEDNKQNI